MRVRIVGTVARPSAASYARAEQPRLNVAAFPYSPPAMLSVTLRPIVPALGILRPIECEAVVSSQSARSTPSTDVNRTEGNCAPVLVKADRHAIDRSFSQERVQVIRGLGPTSILNAVLAPAKLIALRRINAPKANAGPVNLERVAVNDACLPAEIVRERWRGAKAYRREEQSREGS